MADAQYMRYAVTTGAWDPDEYGNHRAVLEVAPGAPADAVGVRVPWRRRDRSPERKGVLLFSRMGTRVTDVLPLAVTNSHGDFLFRPVDGPGRYYLYFMPYSGTSKKPYPQVDYLPADLEPNAWRAANEGLSLSDVPAALVTSLESIDEFNRFTEMELVATPGEIDAMLAATGATDFLVFPESRERPIRMFDAIPYPWTVRGPEAELHETARVGEYFVFQLGVYARRALERVVVRFADLTDETGALAVPADRMTCFNTGGTGWDGKPFSKHVDVAEGSVQPLWCGIDLPLELAPGRYAVTVTVAAGGTARPVRVALTVEGPAVPRRGDDDPWRLSRLRWLNSTIGDEDTLVPPYTPVLRDGNRLGILGREVTLDESGLPARIASRFTDDVQSVEGDPLELLAVPMELVVETAGARTVPVRESFEFTDAGRSFVGWSAASRTGALRFRVDGRLDFDGTLEYAVTVSAEEATTVANLSLETVFRGQVAQLMTGLGRKGGSAPDSFDWRWDVERNQDAVWIGCVNGGLQLTLKDERYSRPLNTNFYHLKPLVMPESWCNAGKGGITIARDETGYRLSCFGGAREILPGAPLRFDFRIAITPFKPIHTASHFATRYYHAYEPLEKIADAGGTTVNIHHASRINPYINYPFLSADILGRYISDAHDRDLDVKLYYTVRELTTRAPELFMLKSLNGEILVHGEGGGHAWLQEHLDNDYIAAWYALAVRDTSVINGVLSRWHNFYVEGMNWLAENLGIDGVYIDDLGFGREIMKRVRRVLHRHRPAPMIDLHSANQYNERDGYASSANLYLEHFPYLDRLWFGEYFDYDEKPDYWLVEISGIPFGLMSEMLQDGGNLWRGMVFGMTGRMPRVPTNVALWKFWDAHGLPDAKMIGFWTSGRAVTTSNDEVVATVYRGASSAVVVVAGWTDADARVELAFDWDRLGYDPDEMRLTIPEIEGIQAEADELPLPGGGVAPEVTVARGKGLFIVIDPRDR